MSALGKVVEISDMCKDAMTDLEVMESAAEIIRMAQHVSETELIQLMFKYSATLTANVATRLTYALMSKSEFDEMANDIKMFDEIEQEVMGDN